MGVPDCIKMFSVGLMGFPIQISGPFRGLYMIVRKFPGDWVGFLECMSISGALGHIFAAKFV